MSVNEQQCNSYNNKINYSAIMSTKAKLYRYFFNPLLNNGLLTCLFARGQKQQKTNAKQTD